jgi:hypothetical protein
VWLQLPANHNFDCRAGEGGMSRSSQFLRYMIASMEQLRMIKASKGGLSGHEGGAL